MLWTVRHRWADGARLAFNCYRHSAILLLRHRNQKATVLLSQEGVTQGDPLSMVLYGLTLVPLAEIVRHGVPDLIHAWYANDACLAGGLGSIGPAVDLILKHGPARGYFMEPEKSVLVCSASLPESALEGLSRFQFHRSNGTRYLGGFVGAAGKRATWLAEQVEKWRYGVERLAMVARRFPQTAYAGLTKSLQSEWQYLQRVVPGLSEAFGPVEDALRKKFFPALLQVDATTVERFRPLWALPPKQGGLGVPDPTTTGSRLHACSKDVTSVLTDALMPDSASFGLAEYMAHARAARRNMQTARMGDEAKALQEYLRDKSHAEVRRAERGKECGAWLTTTPLRLNGTALTAEQFRDAMRIRYGLTPTDMPARCDGCGAMFTVEHALGCKVGGQVGARHNDLKHEWISLCTQALGKASVSDEPLIKTSQDVRNAGARGGEVAADLRGDISVHGFWKRGSSCIFDVRVTDTDQPSQRGTPPTKVLEKHEREKKAKYLAPCLERQHSFTPLVFSVDGLMGPETNAAVKRLASHLASKWSQRYSVVCGYLRSRIAIALVRATGRCLRAERCPIWRAEQPVWRNGDGLPLATERA